MAIWGEVELLCRAISEAGRKAANKVLNQAEAEAQRILARVEEQTNRELQHEEQTRKSELHTEAKHIVDAAEVEARKRVMTFQEEVTQELFSALGEYLNRLRSHSQYAEFLTSSIRQGLELLPGTEFIVELNPADMETIRDRVESMEQELPCRISLQGSDSVRSGALIYTKDRRLLYDNTPSARLARHSDTIRREIWSAIFASEPSTT